MKRKVSDITKDLIKREEKHNAIKVLINQQLNLVKKMLRIMKYPKPKKASTELRRAFKLYVHGIQIVVIQQQIKMISWQPIFPEGGLPIIGEEIIIPKT